MHTEIERLHQDRSHPLHLPMQPQLSGMTLVSTKTEETREGRDQQAKPVPDRTSEKVRGEQYIHVETDKLPPSYGLLSLSSRWNTMTLEDVPNSLITDR